MGLNQTHVFKEKVHQVKIKMEVTSLQKLGQKMDREHHLTGNGSISPLAFLVLSDAFDSPAIIRLLILCIGP